MLAFLRMSLPKKWRMIDTASWNVIQFFSGRMCLPAEIQL